MKPKKLNTYQKVKQKGYELGYAKGVEDERRRVMEFNIKNTQKNKIGQELSGTCEKTERTGSSEISKLKEKKKK
jgi:flagellar biosynthesis/type III secretory pathway protein FliH